MKTPPLFTRLLGNPVVALVLCVWFLYALPGSHPGQSSLPELIIAGCFVLASLGAMRRMRAHRAWLRQWDGIGRTDAATPARISEGGARARRKSAPIVLLPLLGVTLLPMAAGSARPGELPMLRVLFLGCAAWLVAATLQRLAALWEFRKHGGGRAVSAVKAETPSPVAWVTGPARCAPSRAFATSNLPDYALRVMGLRRGIN